MSSARQPERFTRLMRLAREETAYPDLPGLLCSECDRLVSFGGCDAQCNVQVSDVCMCDDDFNLSVDRIHSHPAARQA